MGTTLARGPVDGDGGDGRIDGGGGDGIGGEYYFKKYILKNLYFFIHITISIYIIKPTL